MYVKMDESELAEGNAVVEKKIEQHYELPRRSPMYTPPPDIWLLELLDDWDWDQTAYADGEY